MTTRSHLRRIAEPVVAAAAIALVLAGCSTSGTPIADTNVSAPLPMEEPGQPNSGVFDAPDEPSDDELDAGDTFRPVDLQELQPITFHLWEQAVTPDGWQRVPAGCEAPGGEEMIDRGAGWYTFAVPAEWNFFGRGSGGSGSPQEDQHDLRFDGTSRSNRGDFIAKIEPVRVNEQGEIVDHDGVVTNGSFDYQITTYSSDSEAEYQIAFQSIGTVPLGEQQLEVFVAPQDQAPEVLSRTEYRVLFQVAETPAPHLPQGTISAPMMLTLSHDAGSDRATLSPETVLQIVGSLQLPACTAKHIVVSAELMWEADLNEDGYVSTLEDYQEVLALAHN